MNQMVALAEASAVELPTGTRLLNGQYILLDQLQQGGFGITYVARDSLERHVVIKECYPNGICERVNGQVRAVSPMAEAQFAELKQQFIREARGVATLKHPFIVAVHQVFEENNTAYMALDYVEGVDLITVLEDAPERIRPAFLETTLRQVLKAIWHIHSNGILHRDIAPDNIRVDDANRITLIDFGAAGACSINPETVSAAIPAVKDGYSPPEFYAPGTPQDFSSDFYSLGATYYLLVTGETPPSGDARQAALAAGQGDPYVPLCEGAWAFGHHLLSTIDLALQLDPACRIKSADQWLRGLDEIPHQRPATFQSAAARAQAAFNPELDAIVSRLVLETNTFLAEDTHLHPAGPTPAARKAAAGPKEQGARKWADILGNPIEDISSWLVKQEVDRQATLLAFARSTAPAMAGSEPATERARPADGVATAPRRKSLISGLLSRCLARRPETSPA